MLLSHARRARHSRAVVAAACSLALAASVATAATPVALADGSAAGAAGGSTWSSFLHAQRSEVAVDARRVIVEFDDASMAEWVQSRETAPTTAARATWLRTAAATQQRRLDALAAAGINFQVEHRYVRVINGVSILVHDDSAQRIGALAGVARVTPVRVVWPLAGQRATGVNRAAEAAGSVSPVGAAATRVAVLDSGVAAGAGVLRGRVAAAFDATTGDGSSSASVQSAADDHGTEVASIVAAAAGETPVAIDPVLVLRKQPVADGASLVYGHDDDVIAGLEHAVDPAGDGRAALAADVAVLAVGTDGAAGGDSPSTQAVAGADALGTVVVAAAGNDGRGNVSSFAAADAALAVGAVDLREQVDAVHLHVRGGHTDADLSHATLLTPGRVGLPQGETPVVVIDSSGADVVEYLDANLRTRVAGATVLIWSPSDANVAAQVRAATDAGAAAVVVARDDAMSAAGAIDARGVDVPAVAVSSDDAQAIRDAASRGESVSVAFQRTVVQNADYGEVPSFSGVGRSAGGVARPDIVGPGVGMVVARADGGTSIANGTSLAAAWAAGQIAAIRAAHPAWDAATVRAVAMGTAIPLGTVGHRPAVATQGAGVATATSAAHARFAARGGRIDFGDVRPGARVSAALTIDGLDAAAAAAGLSEVAHVDDGGAAHAVTPTLERGRLVIDVPNDAAAGDIGGWIVYGSGVGMLRVPWSANVVDGDHAGASHGDVTLTLRHGIAGSPVTTSARDDAATVTVPAGMSIARLEVRLVDRAGRDHGIIGSLDSVQPGEHRFSLARAGRTGASLAQGMWRLRVRYRVAGGEHTAWTTGPQAVYVVAASKR